MADVRLTLNRPQTRAMQSIGPHSTTCLVWGRGTGKSWFLRQYWYTQIAEAIASKKKARCILLMPSFKQCKDVHAEHLEAELAGQWAFLGGKIDKTLWKVRFPGGSWIQFFGCENINAARGLRADILTLDEADDIDTTDFDAVAKPWLSEPWSLNIKLICGTPRRGRHGLLWRTFRRGTPGNDESRRDHTSIHSTAYDSPETVSRAIVAEAKRDSPISLFNREWMASFDAGQGRVYESFDENVHVVEPGAVPSLQNFSRILIGVDHGWEDPPAWLAVGVDGHGRDAKLWAIEEAYTRHLTPSDLQNRARDWLKRYPGAQWYADPSRPDSIANLRDAGCNIRPGKNAILDGIASVADKIHTRVKPNGERYTRFAVSRNCPNLIREFGLYKRKPDPKNPDVLTEDIVDKDNHLMDALRYVVFTEFGPVNNRRFERGEEDFDYG